LFGEVIPYAPECPVPAQPPSLTTSNSQFLFLTFTGVLQPHTSPTRNKDLPRVFRPRSHNLLQGPRPSSSVFLLMSRGSAFSSMCVCVCVCVCVCAPMVCSWPQQPLVTQSCTFLDMLNETLASGNIWISFGFIKSLTV